MEGRSVNAQQSIRHFNGAVWLNTSILSISKYIVDAKHIQCYTADKGV